MFYELRNGLFGPGVPFAIANQHGWRLFSAVPSTPWHEELVITDRAGIERATLTRRQLPSGTTYFISRSESTLALVTREPRLLRSRIIVHFVDCAEGHVRGDAAAYEYCVVQGSDTLVRVSNHGSPRADAVGVEIGDEHNAALVLATCIAIDDLAQATRSARLRNWLRRAA